MLKNLIKFKNFLPIFAAFIIANSFNNISPIYATSGNSAYEKEKFEKFEFESNICYPSCYKTPENLINKLNIRIAKLIAAKAINKIILDSKDKNIKVPLEKAFKNLSDSDIIIVPGYKTVYFWVDNFNTDDCEADYKFKVCFDNNLTNKNITEEAINNLESIVKNEVSKVEKVFMEKVEESVNENLVEKIITTVTNYFTCIYPKTKEPSLNPEKDDRPINAKHLFEHLKKYKEYFNLNKEKCLEEIKNILKNKLHFKPSELFAKKNNRLRLFASMDGNFKIKNKFNLTIAEYFIIGMFSSLICPHKNHNNKECKYIKDTSKGINKIVNPFNDLDRIRSEQEESEKQEFELSPNIAIAPDLYKIFRNDFLKENILKEDFKELFTLEDFQKLNKDDEIKKNEFKEDISGDIIDKTANSIDGDYIRILIKLFKNDYEKSLNNLKPNNQYSYAYTICEKYLEKIKEYEKYFSWHKTDALAEINGIINNIKLKNFVYEYYYENML